MKTGRHPDGRAEKLGKRCGTSADTIGVQKYRKIISQEIKSLDNAHIEDDLKSTQSSVDRTNPTEMTERSPLLHLYPTQMPHPRTKIKLQLFPINEKTRIALEKDGYHPHLELTLRARKKMCSVLNHLISKWGCSNAARGELTLFPYSKPSNLVCGLKWTLKDSDISAGDVYAAVGGSTIFRLRTCDAFAMKRLSSSSKNTPSLDARSWGTFQEADSKLFKFPKTPQRLCYFLQAHNRSELSQDPADQESKTDLMFCSRVYHDESSLGLSRINWVRLSDSLGPFDLDLPVSR
ncbi:TSL-kinase interacting protein 1 [Cucurbita argyrosperma subsp. argyrosperma]|nr:TSL-kinase interacting protein 1 [Cucurbita argyrosperma subsp. argyrosperma]